MRFRFVAVLIVLVLTFSVIPMQKTSALDISVRAIKARESDEYSPNTAWELGYTGKGINIAVVDSGVEDQHETFFDKLVGSVLILDDDSPPPDSLISETSSHGTACAGIALGSGGDTDDDGEPDFQGVAKGAKLVDVNINYIHLFPNSVLNEYYHLPIDEAMQWILDNKDTEWEYQSEDYHGIDVVSMSMSGSGLNPNEDGGGETAQLINAVSAAGISVVISAENDGEEPDSAGFDFVASADCAIIVAAVDELGTVNRVDDNILPSSGKGPRMDDGDNDPYDELKPDVAAPGGAITVPLEGTTDEYGGAFGYTSAAAPHVAGIVALMLEANPELIPQKVKDILHITAEPRGTPEYPDYPFPHNKWNRSYGYGIVDAYAAVQMALEYGGGSNGNLSAPIMNTIPSPDDDGAYTVSWSAVYSADSYELIEADNPEFNNSFAFPSLDGTSYYMSGMENGTYYYKVKASDSTRTSDFSNVVSVTVNIIPQPGPGPEPPVELDGPEFLSTPASPDRNGRFNISWSSVIDALGYTLHESTEQGFYDYDTPYKGDATYFEVTGKANGTYYYRVRAYNMTAVSGWSESITVMVALDPGADEEPDGNETKDDDEGFLGIPGFAGAEAILIVALVAMLASLQRKREG
jgi:subtilisin family serine protease